MAEAVGSNVYAVPTTTANNTTNIASTGGVAPLNTKFDQENIHH